jgi:hypothetical protein
MQRLTAMPTVDRMFRVIVAGGIALSTTTPGLVAGCGGATSTPISDAGHDADAFPAEGPAQADAFPQETAQELDAFPQEGPVALEAGSDARFADAGGNADAFPQEGPYFEAGSLDASDAGFPQETASP